MIVHKHNKQLGNKLLACVKTIGENPVADSPPGEGQSRFHARQIVWLSCQPWWRLLDEYVSILEEQKTVWLLSQVRVMVDKLYVAAEICHNIYELKGDQIGNHPKIECDGS